jgi:hypothetical protein
MPAEFTADEKLREVERELKMRRQVYQRPQRYPGEPAMSKANERRLALMESIRADYEKMVRGERLL